MIELQYLIHEGGIEPRTDGTGMIQHDLFAQYSEDGGDTWADVYHHTVVTPGDEAQAIINDGVNIKANYKELLRQNWTTAPQSPAPPILSSGDPDDLEEYVLAIQTWEAAWDDANVVAVDAAAAVIDFVPSWPVTFEV